MLFKLQKRTLVLSQIVVYALTIFVGITIILGTTQFYLDIKPLLSQQTDMFKSNSAVISKNISVFKSIDKEKIYFTQKEIRELKNQEFVKNICEVSRATFEITANTKDQTHKNVPILTTDLFFEGIPDEYLDINNKTWYWDSISNFIPIVIPKNYLNLYNFGVAESQGLPVLSENSISQWEFNIKIRGNNKTQYFKSRIIGFTNEFNSILVPNNFLHWANKKFGTLNTNKISRVLIEFDDPSNKNILQYFNENNYSINKKKLEFGKLTFFFKTALYFVSFIALVIIFLSIAFISLSLNLIIQKNKELILNLYYIGYSKNRIAKFYQVLISSVTLISIIISVIGSNFIRDYYLEKIINLFDYTANKNYILLVGVSSILLLITSYNILINKSISKIVMQRNQK